MECHQCPHAEAVAAGKYRRAPFEKTPCATCELVEDPGSMESYDDERPGEDDRQTITLPDGSSVEDIQLPLSVLTKGLALLMSVHPKAREVVWLRWGGLSFPAIARRLHITVEAAEMRHVRALKSRPLLRNLFASRLAPRRAFRENNKRVLTNTP
jgi:hypothetical protein